mmetsp:Transcript_1162/g.7544  ORF Transcript_1162/g.7544 Transcript_1162/m.7544 type:complete len:207 (+) Transcript_1162:1523-2143(+)
MGETEDKATAASVAVENVDSAEAVEAGGSKKTPSQDKKKKTRSSSKAKAPPSTSTPTKTSPWKPADKTCRPAWTPSQTSPTSWDRRSWPTSEGADTPIRPPCKDTPYPSHWQGGISWPARKRDPERPPPSCSRSWRAYSTPGRRPVEGAGKRTPSPWCSPPRESSPPRFSKRPGSSRTKRACVRWSAMGERPWSTSCGRSSADVTS